MAGETTGKEGFSQDESKSLGKQGLEYVLKKVNETGIWITGDGTKSTLLKNHVTDSGDEENPNINAVYAPYGVNAGTDNVIYTSGTKSFVEGTKNVIGDEVAHGDTHCSHVEGTNNKVLYYANTSHVEGTNNTATVAAYTSHIEGSSNTATDGANTSHIEGSSNTATDGANTSHIEGSSNTAAVGANTSHVEGSSNTATDGANTSHIEGSSNTAAEGANTSHVEGTNNTVHSRTSHAEGIGNSIFGTENTVDSDFSGNHIQGIHNSIFDGEGIHVEGKCNSASGLGNHVEGVGSKAWSITITATPTTKQYNYVLESGYESFYVDFNTNDIVGRWLTDSIGGEPMYKVVARPSTDVIELDEVPTKTSLYLCLGAYNQGSHVEGVSNLAMRPGASAAGTLNIALGTQAWVTGLGNESTGDNSFVTGKNNSAAGQLTTILGCQNVTMTSGFSSAVIAVRNFEVTETEDMVYVPAISIVENGEATELSLITENELTAILNEFN